jgi:hypothetical protein
MQLVRIIGLILFIAILSLSSSTSSQSAPKRKYACMTPENAKTCYWTHGRLVLANGGSPNYRLWKIGTGRILGIYAGPARYPQADEPDLGTELPAMLQRYDFMNVELFGDFEVCPLAPLKEGHMQPACIETAKNIVAK